MHTARIRPATLEDSPALAAIYNHYIDHTCVTFETETVEPEEMARRAEQCQGAGLPWLLAEGATGILGYAYASKWRARHGYRFSVETTVYLQDGASGQGLGSQLYRQLLGELRAGDFHLAIAGIALPNQASVALHEKLGFVECARFAEVGTKFDRWVDVGYWQLRL